LLAFDVKIMEPPHDYGPKSPRWPTRRKISCRRWGFSGVEIDKRIAAMATDLRDPFGIIVAARSAGAGVGSGAERRRRDSHPEWPAHGLHWTRLRARRSRRCLRERRSLCRSSATRNCFSFPLRWTSRDKLRVESATEFLVNHNSYRK